MFPTLYTLEPSNETVLASRARNICQSLLCDSYIYWGTLSNFVAHEPGLCTPSQPDTAATGKTLR